MNIAHTKTNLDPGPRRPKGGLILGAPHAVIPWVTPYYQTQAKRSTLKNPRPHHCSWGDMMFTHVYHAVQLSICHGNLISMLTNCLWPCASCPCHRRRSCSGGRREVCLEHIMMQMGKKNKRDERKKRRFQTPRLWTLSINEKSEDLQRLSSDRPRMWHLFR